MSHRHKRRSFTRRSFHGHSQNTCRCQSTYTVQLKVGIIWCQTCPALFPAFLQESASSYRLLSLLPIAHRALNSSRHRPSLQHLRALHLLLTQSLSCARNALRDLRPSARPICVSLVSFWAIECCWHCLPARLRKWKVPYRAVSFSPRPRSPCTMSPETFRWWSCSSVSRGIWMHNLKLAMTRHPADRSCSYWLLGSSFGVYSTCSSLVSMSHLDRWLRHFAAWSWWFQSLTFAALWLISHEVQIFSF